MYSIGLLKHPDLNNLALIGTPSQLPSFIPLTYTLGPRSHKMLPCTLYIIHFTYTPAKFEVAMSNSLRDAFTRKYIIQSQGQTKCFPVPSTSCDLCTCKIWSLYVKQNKRIQENTFFTLALTLGSRPHKTSPSTLYIMRSMNLQSLKLLCLTL